MGFFDDLPGRLERPLPAGTADEPSGMIGGFVGSRVVLVRTEQAYVAIQSFEVFPSGAKFELVVRFRQRSEGPETWHTFLSDQRGLRVGVEYADGRKGATEQYAAVPRAMRPSEVILSPRGGVGHPDEHHQIMWLSPLPTSGPMRWVSAWPEMGVAEHWVEVDGSELASAAAATERLWPAR